ncbi:crotonobetainyl-CoA:carnitine CoA-transferase CaiB-like acyl-CoA transferase [Nocardia kruczakiae]|uniref:Crotonobetainyl-CoA:carnitine CoA-transferase CaiB-like acyl-CoA transferase n=1 Tax=Nocardia kruczakiae TaxID=261477 RepID=A0ABU1X9R5_9NOCA|nr:CoA transferase [Nocardia kruczakiae]MDR7167285.1 crotonobetainyl-CoA:carnitine CoA-transferase CaiB-like acyl-CoA transferase [Nocardia kruczakiae]
MFHGDKVTMAESARSAPLAGVPCRVLGGGPAAIHAERLLTALGATVADVTCDDTRYIAVNVGSSPAVQDWAESGAMAVTGRTDGPPSVAAGSAASATRAWLAVFAALREVDGSVCHHLPGVEILGERAALLGRGRNGPWSVGGAFRVLPTADGYLGVSLPRSDDFVLLPALIQGEISGEPWEALADWARTQRADEAAERAQLLGIAAATVPTSPSRPHDEQYRGRHGKAALLRPGGIRRNRRHQPLIVDFTALWAGPLCAHLLGLTGAQVVKVESTQRPDGARSGPRDFYDLMHSGHSSVAVDFTTTEGIETLQHLIDAADLVLEASRPRALRTLGIDAEAAVDAGTNWLGITAYGRCGPWSDRIGFGDDVAAAAGATFPDGPDILPGGDALADPMTGVYAAATAAAMLLSDRAFLADISMRDVVASAVEIPAEPHDVVRDSAGRWRVRTPAAEFQVRAPRARRASAPASELGADTQEVLARWIGP